MDQLVGLRAFDRRQAIENLAGFVAASIDAARFGDVPFGHLVFDRVFPEDVYDSMLAAMPVAADYRPMSGRAKGNDAPDGTHTRVKIDLFPEYIRSLPRDKRAVWDVVGQALCSDAVKQAFMRRLAPGLRRRFGPDFAGVGMYPLPILTRDIAGYRIKPHPDTHWKGITVQFYLPRDNSIAHVGTVFHQVQLQPNYALPKHSTMTFARNSGYAFAVDKDTWHSVDLVGPEVQTRDSILLTYFVDAGALRFVRNRAKRLGNCLLNELRNAVGRG